ncbi:hypothetical protein [Leifsonia sp. TF02-11]|uniref:hypothetical protein n=1 Tax=Leifsonia sp. TF02-11 TaxID=2815212 RepID=UPI001AA13B7F|nr:hypothetical protein [Leifsonia sp. TF02-11]MBO1739799.1 hypothetical protein [Leifsonia sp. TF02-11]
MASFKLDPNGVEIYIGSDATVTPVTDFTTKEQQIDKSTGLPLYKVNAELIVDGAVETVALKIASKDAFTLQARTEYKVNGSLYATPWLKDGARNVSVSFKLVGSLIPAKAPRGE